MSFSSPVESQAHSLKTLEALYRHDDFMRSIQTLAYIGCGICKDLEGWATRETRDPERPQPLNINCTGFDTVPELNVAKQYSNISYQKQNFEDEIKTGKKKFDVIWCHDAFQHAINPTQTLSNWWHSMNPDGMIIIQIPTTINFHGKRLYTFHKNHTLYHYSLVNLMYMLAMNGFDTADGFLKHDLETDWLQVAVYKSPHEPMNPAEATWHEMAEKQLIPQCAIDSLNKHNFVRLEDLVLPWVDKALTWYGK